METSFKRQAPIAILFNLGKLSILLILPLLRGFLGALTGDFFLWSRGAWIDILVVMGIIGFAVGRWANFFYQMNDSEIIIKRGVLLRESFAVPLGKVTTVSYKTGLVMRLFKCSKVFVDTPAGSSKKADLRFIVRESEAKCILLRQGVFLGEKSYPDGFRTKSRYAILFSALMSNSFAGTIIFSAFIYQAGDVLGRDFSDMLYGKFEEMGERLSFGFPPAAAAIAYILLAGYFLSFLINFVNYQNFTVSGADHSIYISSGYFNRQEHILTKSKVVYLDITQTVLTRLMGAVNIFIRCVGFGKYKHTVSSLVPVIKKERYYNVTEHILPSYKETKLSLKPRGASVFRFIFFPLAIMLGLFALRRGYLSSLRSWGQTLDYISFMAYVPCVWYMAVRLIDFSSHGVGREGSFFTLCFSEKLTLHKIIIKKENIVSINIRRSIFQLMTGTCDVVINTFSERRASIFQPSGKIRLKSLRYSRAREIFLEQ